MEVPSGAYLRAILGRGYMNVPLFDILVAGEINPDLIVSGDVVPASADREGFRELDTHQKIIISQ